MDRLNRWTNGNRSSKVTTPLMRKTSGWSKKPVKVIHPKAPEGEQGDPHRHPQRNGERITDIGGPEIEAGAPAQNPPHRPDMPDACY